MKEEVKIEYKNSFLDYLKQIFDDKFDDIKIKISKEDFLKSNNMITNEQYEDCYNYVKNDNYTIAYKHNEQKIIENTNRMLTIKQCELSILKDNKDKFDNVVFITTFEKVGKVEQFSISQFSLKDFNYDYNNYDDINYTNEQIKNVKADDKIYKANKKDSYYNAFKKEIKLHKKDFKLEYKDILNKFDFDNERTLVIMFNNKNKELINFLSEKKSFKIDLYKDKKIILNNFLVKNINTLNPEFLKDINKRATLLNYFLSLAFINFLHKYKF